MKVEIDKEVAEDLISYKLRNVKEEIRKILQRWNETESASFLKKARDGTYSEAENDAIDLTQLLLEEKRLKELSHSI